MNESSADVTVQRFIKERVRIGQGMVSVVYSWNGYAYKCFADSYPQSLVEHEINILKQVSETGLPTVRCYDSEFPMSVKTDIIRGVTMADRILKEKYEGALDDFCTVFKPIHTIKELAVPELTETYKRAIASAQITEEERDGASFAVEKVLSEIKEDNCLCHMDYHFLNLMYGDGKYTIIDWIGAHNGKPIFDYARTYVIMYEFARSFASPYRKKILTDLGYGEKLFDAAILSAAAHRLSEYNDPKIHRLIEKINAVWRVE